MDPLVLTIFNSSAEPLTFADFLLDFGFGGSGDFGSSGDLDLALALMLGASSGLGESRRGLPRRPGVST